MSIAYFDCASGIAGDMILGAMMDCGLPLRYLTSELSKLHLGGYQVKRKKISSGMGIKGISVRVDVRKESALSHYEDIRKLIKGSKLSGGVKELACEIFHRLAKAEAHVHGFKNLEKVHFHELSSTDSIVDIVGAAIGFNYFDFGGIYSSPLPMNRGIIKCHHGALNIPAPATMELIKGVPLERSYIKEELVTPTGAAIITTVAENFGESPIQKVKRTGYGYGEKKIPGVTNALRLILGEGYPVVVIEANIDDMNPQFFDYVMDRLFKAGAVDVYLQNIQMKKNRPAVLLQCQAPWDKKDTVIDIILRETTTIGVRYYPVERRIFKRDLRVVKTKIGSVRVKAAIDENGKVIKRIPEYEDIKRISAKKKISILKTLQEVQRKCGY